MIKKYDWALIQQQYDGGMSQTDILRLYGMSSRTIVLATKRGEFTPRSKADAMAVWRKDRPPHKHSNETKDRMREIIKTRYDQGWMPKAGRCKKYKHTSPVAGTVSLDGTWELAVAAWLDKQGYTWLRNTKRFSYTHPNGKQSWYTPDFWVEEFQSFVEIKGHETDLDRCKWAQFTEPLIVWKRTELRELNII